LGFRQHSHPRAIGSASSISVKLSQ
jgi:hypothetical protein